MSAAPAPLSFVDTTLRDGPQTLWSLNMTTAMMLPALDAISSVGYDAVEVMSTAEFKKCVRDLKEDPWLRLRHLRAGLPNTGRRFIRGRNVGTFQLLPDSLDALWTERFAANGVTELRMSDSSNTAANWRNQVALVRSYGLGAVINVIYSHSPKHSDEYYARRTREAAAIRPDRICLKDPGALITPDRVQRLVPIVLAEAGDIPVEFHTHCLTGLGAACTFEAMRLGVACVNTATPPLANGASNPSVFTALANARAIGRTPTVDDRRLPEVEAHFTAVARRHGFPVGKPADFDYAQYEHQIPGGMISNFQFQLDRMGMADRLPAILEETARGRAELGHPIMVTPYSQFVGSQAAVNVITGERYKMLTDELIQYALGMWGEVEAEEIEPDLRDRILGSPRAKELAARPREQPTLEGGRRQYGGPGVWGAALLLRLGRDTQSVEAMKAHGAGFAGNGPVAPLAALIERLHRLPAIRHVTVHRQDLSIELGRS